MRKKEISSVLSAIVLIVYAVVWIISFIFYQMNIDRGKGMATILFVLRSVLQVFVYVVLLYGAWKIRGGFIYKTVILIVTLWLIFCAVAQFIPGIEIQTLQNPILLFER